MSVPRIAFIGIGNLASAIVRGLLKDGAWSPADIGCTSRTGVTARKISEKTGIKYEPNLPALLGPADFVVIAFKPQSLATADPQLAELTRGKLVLSVLAGKTLSRLKQSFPHARNIVRTMPNTPAAIGKGMTAYCSLGTLTAGDQETVQRFLSAFGQSLPVEEANMDAITALNGSGPAFLFEFVAALRDAGVEAKIPPALASKLAIETVLGAASQLAYYEESPEQLRDKVTSPNGTTFAGLQVLGQRQFRETLKETILAATRRAGELSKD